MAAIYIHLVPPLRFGVKFSTSSPFPTHVLVVSTTRDLILGLLATVVLSYIVTTIYSVYLGPLSKFPGPKLAAATLCYEFYYDIVCDGRYSWKTRELHKQYGLLGQSRGHKD